MLPAYTGLSPGCFSFRTCQACSLRHGDHYHDSDHLVLRSDLLPAICLKQYPKDDYWERVAAPNAWVWQGSGSNVPKTLAQDRTWIAHTTSTKKPRRKTSTTLLISCCYGTKNVFGLLLNDHAGHSPCLPVCHCIGSISTSAIPNHLPTSWSLQNTLKEHLRQRHVQFSRP